VHDLFVPLWKRIEGTGWWEGGRVVDIDILHPLDDGRGDSVSTAAGWHILSNARWDKPSTQELGLRPPQIALSSSPLSSSSGHGRGAVLHHRVAGRDYHLMEEL
jgi:hypothetical protein